MIPRTVEDLDSLVAEIERQHHEVSDLFEAVPEEARTWRPDETRWSMTGHLRHLCIVNEAYQGAMAEALRSAEEEGGPRSDGPWRHPWIARWFVRSMDPPPKRRLKTFRSMVPEPDVDPAVVRARFRGLQAELEELVEGARGLDLGKIRFGSPYVSLLRLSLGAGLELVLAHNRRHLWLIRELQERGDFPEAAST